MSARTLEWQLLHLPRKMASSGADNRGMNLAAIFAVLAVTSVAAPPADPQLDAFKTWLDRAHPGYGCDLGPARFENKTVASAYPGLEFYYVLTYARGIRPPFENAITLVAEVNDRGGVRPLRDLAAFRAGLIKASSAKNAKLAAAAVMSLASCGERRWSYAPEAFVAKKKNGGWVCSYEHGSHMYVSQVAFDKRGSLCAISSGAPPVP